MQLTELIYYPVKSMRGINIMQTEILPMGIKHDRCWLLTDLAGNFITARKYPQLLLWQATVETDGLHLTAPDGESRFFPTEKFTVTSHVTVWKDTFAAQQNTNDADQWLSSKIGTPCRLNYIGAPSNRTLANTDTPLSFADGAPYLLTNQASLAALNATLPRTVEMRRFRPNLVIDGTQAYEEENWREIQIGSVRFELFKPCTRCVMTTVDLHNGEKDPQQQPLKTLAQTRKAIFGMNMRALNSGTVAIGDTVTVLA